MQFFRIISGPIYVFPLPLTKEFRFILLTISYFWVKGLTKVEEFAFDNKEFVFVLLLLLQACRKRMSHEFPKKMWGQTFKCFCVNFRGEVTPLVRKRMSNESATFRCLVTVLR